MQGGISIFADRASLNALAEIVHKSRNHRRVELIIYNFDE